MRARNLFVLWLLTQCVLLVSGAHASAQVFDADADWSATENPNGPWSYHNAATGGPLLRTTSGVGGSPGGWSLDGTATTAPNLFTGPWSFAQETCEIGGHGPWEVRWTSPLSGEVQVTATLLQIAERSRRMKAEIRLNGEPLQAALIPELPTGETQVVHQLPNPGTPGTRVPMAEIKLDVDVEPDDTIALAAIAAAGDEGGNGVDTFVLATFTIVQGDPPTPCLENCSNGIDDDEDGDIDCFDSECGCNTLEGGELLLRFPDVIDTRLRIFIDNVTVSGHTVAGTFQNFECPASPLPDEDFIPVDFTNGCWYVDTTAEFDTATLTMTAFLSTDLVTEEEAAMTTVVRLEDGGLPEDVVILPTVAPVEVVNGGFEYEITVTAETTEFSTFALAIPTDPVCLATEPDHELSCDDGADNDCDGAVDGDDEDCGDAPPLFLRGDCDGNGVVGGSPTEAIILLTFAFRGGDEPPCLAACDAEANGSIGVTDALRILRHAFLGIGAPDPPFPECGESGGDELSCETPPKGCL